MDKKVKVIVVAGSSSPLQTFCWVSTLICDCQERSSLNYFSHVTPPPPIALAKDIIRLDENKEEKSRAKIKSEIFLNNQSC